MRSLWNNLVALPLPYSEYAAPEPPLPIGTILIVNIGGGLSLSREVIELCSSHPWCPTCVLLPDNAPVSAFDLQLLMTLGSPKLAFMNGAVARMPAAAVVKLVDGRQMPDASGLAGAVASRLSQREIQPWLEACLTNAFRAGKGPSRDTLRRHIGGFGLLRPHQWRWIPGTLRAVMHARANPSLSLVRAAADCGLDVRSLRTHVSELTGLSLRSALAYAGWEWFIETVLRRWEYVGGMRAEATQSDHSVRLSAYENRSRPA